MSYTFNRRGVADHPLTARESEILDLIARGLTSKQIARHLNISPYTVNTHRDNLRRKLGVHNGAQLASYHMRMLQAEEAASVITPHASSMVSHLLHRI